METALNDIPRCYRTPLLLRMQGFPYREIGVTLGLPAGTVKSRIHSRTPTPPPGDQVAILTCDDHHPSPKSHHGRTARRR